MNIKSRKVLLTFFLITLLTGLTMISCNSQKEKASAPSPKGTEIKSDDALKLLKDGNKRFVDGKNQVVDLTKERKEDLSKNGQFPYAVILTCADSRVSPELLFNEGLGNVFVVRNAGNVVDDISLGSVEYGAEHLHAPLVIVLGHDKCGAVKATIDGGDFSKNIIEIAKLITPAYELAKKATTDKTLIYGKTEEENIKLSVNNIKNSDVIKHLLEEKKVKVVGAKYSLESGAVTFFE